VKPRNGERAFSRQSRPAPRWLCAAALIFSGCGYIGEPMNPLLNIPNHVTDLAAVERGDKIIFQFTVPPLTTEGKQARIGRIEVRAGEAGDTFNADEWAARSKLIEVKQEERKHIQSEIPAASWVGKNLALGVKVYGMNKRDAGWSNFAIVTVVQPLVTPSDVQATPVAEGVRVDWKGQAGQYRVFRRVEQGPDLLLATIEANQWVDAATEYGKQYQYLIQAVQKTGNGEVESEFSEPRGVTPEDKFPPAVPAGLSAIVGTDNIELVWDRNTDPDLAGYHLYRAAGDGKLEKIADVQDAPSYSDRKLESGKRYRYAVSAMDRSGNESKPSEPVEITAP
jgi:fibronectin type 3 domain-containing protein